MKNIKLQKTWLSFCLALSLLLNAFILAPVRAQTRQEEFRSRINEHFKVEADVAEKFEILQKSTSGSESRQVLDKLLGADQAAEIGAFIQEDAGDLFRAMHKATEQRLESKIENRIKALRETSPTPVNKQRRGFMAPVMRPNNYVSMSSWRSLAFGFQPLLLAVAPPEIKVEETENGINTLGETSKTFETDKAMGTRTEKGESRTIVENNRFGTEIKSTTVVDLKMKAEQKTFRQEITIRQLVETPLCPDADGLLAGQVKAEVLNKTTIGVPKDVTAMTVDLVIDMTMTTRVDDDAEMIGYDLEGTATEKRFGINRALSRDFITTADAKDGDYSVRYRIKDVRPKFKVENEQGETIESPVKPGTVTAFINSVDTTQADAQRVDKLAGGIMQIVDYYVAEKLTFARGHWRSSGCVEVDCRAPKTVLKPNEQIEITAQSIHKLDKKTLNAKLKSDAYPGEVTPENQSGTPSAKFSLIAPPKEELEGDKTIWFYVTSVSRRGIGSGNLEFNTGKVKPREEEPSEPDENCETGWMGTIKIERKLHEEKQKRSGNNLLENGGSEETVTSVLLKIGAANRDEGNGEANAFLMPIVAKMEETDFEYHKYGNEEGFCGAAAAPYKGSLEKTRTSHTTAEFTGEISVLLGMSRNSGTINFSLPEMSGKTEHAETHKSACDFNDRANTKKSTSDEVSMSGAHFSFTFPIDSNKQIITGSKTVREDDGGVTIYTYQLTRCRRGRK